jgi:pimeloyl-ACP methyl ester carboxylesterase
MKRNYSELTDLNTLSKGSDMLKVLTLGLSISSGLTFTADVAGPIDGPLVLLLHGFPESRHSWRAALPVLAAAGYRAVAPDQRGYSPGARPDPAELANYAFDKLVADAIEIAAAAGHDGKRFHLVGHDWGGQVSWGVAAKHPERLASLTILSRPHPQSFRRALLKEDGDQKHRSRHHRAFLDPKTGKMLLADNARRLRSGLFGQGVPETALDEHLSVLGNPAAIEAALAGTAPTRGWRPISAPSKCRRSTSGAMPMPPSDPMPRTAPASSSRRPLPWRCCRASAIS